jgi:histone-lysine N-methyltransferase SETMAR
MGMPIIYPSPMEEPISHAPLHDLELRAVCHFLTLEGYATDVIFHKMSDVYREFAPAKRTIQRWKAAFLKGKSFLEDKPRSGRPADLEMRAEIQEVIEEDKTLTQREIAALTGHSPSTVGTVLGDDLHLVRSSVKYVPHILSPVHMEERTRVARQLLTFLKMQPEKALPYLWTQDETWITLKSPSTFVWLSRGEERPEIEKTTVATKKVMLSVMMNFQEDCVVTVLPKKTTFTREFFAHTVLREWENHISEQRRRTGVRGCYLHMDNSRTHNVEELLRSKGVERLPHPPYSPDLAPIDFALFGRLKDYLVGREFNSGEEVKEAVGVFFAELKHWERLKIFETWKARLEKCIGGNGALVE